MKLTAAHKELLRDLLHESLKSYQFPEKSSFVMRHKRQIEEFEQLERERLVRTEQRKVVLTLAGLLEARSETLAVQLLKDFSNLWRILERAYETSPDTMHDASELAGLGSLMQGGTGQSSEVAYALTLLRDLKGWSDEASSSNALITAVRITQGVYKFNADNWIEKFEEQNATLIAAEGHEILAGPYAGQSFDRDRAESPEPFIFVSHAGDEELAEALRKALGAAGVNTFKASSVEGGLKGGKAWFDGIMAGLKASTGLVYVATPHSVTKHWPTFEVGAVFGRDCPALTILCQGAGHDHTPDPLKNIENVLATNSDEKIKGRIAAAVGRTSNELWSKPEAARAIAAFLELARKVSKAESATSPPVQQRSIVSWTVPLIINHRSDWNALKILKPARLAEGKKIMASVRDEVGALLTVLRKKGVPETMLDTLTEALQAAAGLERAPSETQIGFDVDGFWKTGDLVLFNVHRVLTLPEIQAFKE